MNALLRRMLWRGWGSGGGLATPDAPVLDPGLPLEEADFVVFDTELTGLDSAEDSVVSLGAVRMSGARMDVGDHFYRALAPRTKMKKESILVHGITPTEALGAPRIESVLPEFLDFSRGAVLVGHFVSIDVAFMNAELRHLGMPPLGNPSVDTVRLFRWLERRRDNHCAYYDDARDDMSLGALAARHGIAAGGAHNSLADAYVTAQLLQRFLKFSAPLGVRTLGELARIGKP